LRRQEWSGAESRSRAWRWEKVTGWDEVVYWRSFTQSKIVIQREIFISEKLDGIDTKEVWVLFLRNLYQAMLFVIWTIIKWVWFMVCMWIRHILYKYSSLKYYLLFSNFLLNQIFHEEKFNNRYSIRLFEYGPWTRDFKKKTSMINREFLRNSKFTSRALIRALRGLNLNEKICADWIKIWCWWFDFLLVWREKLARF